MNFTKTHCFTLAIAAFLCVSHTTYAATDDILTESRIHAAQLAATKKARELGRAGTFILIERHGKLIASYRMHGALPSTFGFAKSKAETAVALGIPTGKLQSALPPAILNNITTTQGGKYVMFPGGFPVRIGKHLIGGVAFGSTIVSLDSNVPNKDTPNQDADVQCAKAALTVLTKTDTTGN